jgi:hypothetical protein
MSVMVPNASRKLTNADKVSRDSLGRDMKPYRDKRGKSGVSAYETGPDFIIVRFKSGDTYLYGASRPGPYDVAMMKQLAESGEGLSTYISQYVNDRYEQKLA